jgi:hypothetical protein
VSIDLGWAQSKWRRLVPQGRSAQTNRWAGWIKLSRILAMSLSPLLFAGRLVELETHDGIFAIPDHHFVRNLVR